MLKLLFKNRPVLANSISGFIIFCTGDIISQFIPCLLSTSKENPLIDILMSKKVDWKRAFCFGGLGVGMNGVTLSVWYKFLDNFVGTSMTSKKTVFVKMIADQLIYAPFSIFAYFGFATWLESLKFQHSSFDVIESYCDRVNSDLVPTWITDCMVWPPANYINFRYISLNYRPTFVGIVQIFWQSYLSYISHKPVHASVQSVST